MAMVGGEKLENIGSANEIARDGLFQHQSLPTVGTYMATVDLWNPLSEDKRYNRRSNKQEM